MRSPLGSSRYGRPRPVRRGRWVEPIAELKTPVPKVTFTGNFGDLVDPRLMLGYWARGSQGPPKRWYSVHGTNTAASPHAAAGSNGNVRGTQGRNPVQCRASPVPPSGRPATTPTCPNSHIGRTQRARRQGWSPVQPRRSSRWGSRGDADEVARILHTMFSCRRFNSASEHSNQPVRRMSVWQTIASTALLPTSPGHPSSSA